MNATLASSARPLWAITVWCDNTHIFTELPSVNGGAPYIQKYALTEGGLSKAISLMRDLYAKHQPLGGDYTIPLNPLIKHAQGINNFSPDQRQAARDILRKLKVI